MAPTCQNGDIRAMQNVTDEKTFGCSVLAQAGHIEGLNKDWEQVLHLGKPFSFEKDTIIPHQKLGGFYYLLKGEVVISYSSYDGTERIVLFVKPQCLFNEARSVSDYNPHVQFRCRTDADIYRFESTLLEDEDFIKANPHLLSNIINSMGTKMLIHYAYLTEMGVGTPTTLLARFILSLMQKNKNTCFPSNMTQQTVADLLGVHRTTLARAIQQLQRQGVIYKFTSREVSIGDVKLLEMIAKQ